MSLFGSIAHAIGHTVDSLANEIGTGVDELEGLVNDLSADGIEVFSNAARLGLSPVGFLRGMLDLMHGDPHQLLLNHLVSPFKPVDGPLHTISAQWVQFAALHQETAQQINTHIAELFQGDAYSYSGPAANTLWDTHIEENPNLTEAQLRELLAQYGNVIAANPNLVKNYGALAVFLEFIALAAYDAGHGGNYPSRQPVVNMPNLQEGIREANAEMGAMENGDVPWPLEPSTDPAYDAIDPNGVKWDEKSYRSVDTNGNPYDPENTVNKLQKDFGKGEKVIFDDSQLTQKEIDETYEELKKRGQEDDVVWWPTKPTQLS